MGERARERALAEQTWDRRVERYDALLDSVIGPRRAIAARRQPAPAP